MERRELLERYEALGDERDFEAAKSLYEAAVAEGSDATTALELGYLLESHGRNELRRAVECYERAIDLDPDADQPHYQLISARAGLREPERAIDLYEARLAASPKDVREHRFLARAYLAGHEFAKARKVVGAGLELAPDDAALVEARGEAKAGLGDPEGALADWALALGLAPENASPLYSTAFLLEREGRLDDSIATWRAIVAWNEARGFLVQAEWPKQMLERLCAARPAR